MWNEGEGGAKRIRDTGSGGRRAKSDALQDILIAETTAAPVEAKQDGEVALQDLLKAQPPVVVGLIAHLTGATLQDDIAEMMGTLHSRGRAVLGIDAGRPDYAKTPDRSKPGAAYAAPI